MTGPDVKGQDTQPVVTTPPLLGIAGVLLGALIATCTVSFLIPFCHSLEVVIALLIIAGLSAGTFYPLTLSFMLRSLPIRYVLIGMYATDIVFTTNALADAKLLGLQLAFAVSSSGLTAMGRAAEVLGLQVRQQALSLVISDSFLLAACCVACLVTAAFISAVSTKYRQITAAAVEAK